jgi:hypothetical protein
VPLAEIHKHAHVLDYYSPDSGLSGEISGKALRIRLFDMDVYSRRIEKVYKIGAEKRVRLLATLLKAVDNIEGNVEINFFRTIPDDFEELAPILNTIQFMSEESKMERLGIDVDKEKKRLGKQRTAKTERIDIGDSEIGLDPETDSEEEE